MFDPLLKFFSDERKNAGDKPDKNNQSGSSYGASNNLTLISENVKKETPSVYQDHAGRYLINIDASVELETYFGDTYCFQNSLPPSVTASDSIDILGLPIRLENSLRNADIETIDALYNVPDKKLLRVKNVGYKSRRFINLLKKAMTPIYTSQNYEKQEPEIIKMDEIQLNPLMSSTDPIGTLELPTRVENALVKHGITTVGDFFSYPITDFLKIRNIGSKCVQIFEKIRSRIGSEETTQSSSESTFSNQHEEKQLDEPLISPEKLLEILLTRCGNQRSTDVVKKRYGLENGEKHTLEEIGKSYGVSRERIRQIEEKAVRKMKHPSTRSRKQIINLAGKTLWGNGGIINDTEADKIIPGVFGNNLGDGSLFLDLIADLLWVQRHKIGDISFYSPIASQMYEIKITTLMEGIFLFLKSRKTITSLEQIVEAMEKSTEIQFSDWERLIHKCCLLDPRIEEKVENQYTLYESHLKTKTWSSLILSVLEKEQGPLHFTEINDRLNDLLEYSDNHLDVRRVHSILIQDHQFAHTGVRGTYGLTKWGIRKETTPELVAECIKKAGFPLHIDQIYKYVNRFKDSPRGNIRSILELNPIFEKLQNGMYGLSSSS